MSQASASGVPSPSGVVRNSALSFVEEVAYAQAPSENDGQNPTLDETSQPGTERAVPAGLKALCEVYSRLYPDQPNPLQVTTRLKYWLGGHDPLDYISMYWNPGKPEENIPPHWHYVSFGASDLHGDGRVHPPPRREGASPSGFGLELSARVPASGPQPPLWPAALLQALARYMFTTGNKLCAGDHISWHAPLDGDTANKPRVKHLLVAQDPQLEPVTTPYGTVCFLQVVGCTGRELRAAQRGSCEDVLQRMTEDPRVGAGPYMLTRVKRRVSARGLGRRCSSRPAALAGVSAAVQWKLLPGVQPLTIESASSPEISLIVEQQIKDTLQRGLSSMSTDRTGPEGHMSTDSFEMSSIEQALPDIEPMQSSWRNGDEIEYYPGVHLIFNAEGASLLPLAIDGRVAHSCHFTWRGPLSPRAVTFLAPHTPGAVATTTQPYAARGHWLQVLLPKPLAQDMSKKFSKFDTLAETDSESGSEEETVKTEPTILPLTHSWPEYNLKITVVQDLGFL